MKDWRFWVLLIAVYLLVKMCGGCKGCGCSSDISDNNNSEKKEFRGNICSGCGANIYTAGKYLNGKVYCTSCYDDRKKYRNTYY